MRKILILGASKGLGNSIVDGIGKAGDTFYLVSRDKPIQLELKTNYEKKWIKADLSRTEDTNVIAKAIGRDTLDVIIYNAGIWEEKSFEKIPQQEVTDIIHVNLTSVILAVQRLLPNIRKGRLKKIILIGSTSGLENEGSDAVVYTATKFGMRGIAHALREYLRSDSIAVSCISPGSMATEVPFAKGRDAALKKHKHKRMPVADIIGIIDMIIASSTASCIKEVHVPALQDTDA